METINISETNNEVIITLKGKIDVKKAAELDNILKDLIENKKNINTITINLKNIISISSAALRTLVKHKKNGAISNKCIAIEEIKPSIREVLDLTGFSSILEIDA